MDGFGLRQETEGNAIRAAATAQAEDFIWSRPHHFLTPVAQGGANVSGGQRQRLSIARAIARPPQVYLFDDSFSALDYKTDAALRKALHEQAVGDIVVAHSWFRTLSGLDYAAGFSAERILHEYEVALNTVILAEQDELTEPIRAVIASVLGLDTTSLQIVNRPPTRSKPIYMKVWEARKADGLDYDPEDERQQAFLSEITKYNIRSIE